MFNVRGILALIALLIVYIGLATAHAVFAPLTTGPDELSHFDYVSFIADEGRLPATSAEREAAGYKSDQPPLYHLIVAMPMAFVDPAGPPYLKRVSDHPRRQLIERTRHAWGLHNTLDEAWPYRGAVLRWQVGRWTSIFFGALTVAVTFGLAFQIFGQWLPALGAAGVVAFVPRFILTGSMLNYETMLSFCATLFLWLLIALARRETPSLIWAFVLGLTLGLSITAKLSALILPLVVALGLGLVVWHHGWTLRQWVTHVSLAALGTLSIAGLWFGFVVYQFNTVASDGWWTGLLRPLIAADASDATTNRLLNALTGGEAGFAGAIDNLDSGPVWEWAYLTFRTFWMVGIEQQFPLGAPGLVIALGLCLAAGFGLIRDRKSLVMQLLLVVVGAAFVLPLIRYAATFSLSDTAQGRHILFLTAPACGILLVWGLRNLAPARRYLVLLPAGFVLVWTLVQLWTMSWAYRPPLPVSTQPDIAAQIQHRLNQPITNEITLLGYDLHIHEELLQVDLWWRAEQISPVDYLTEVSLTHPVPGVLEQWLGYPANGRYPTRAWDAGDIIKDTAWVPRHVPIGDYPLVLNLLTLDEQPVLSQPLTLTTFFNPDPPLVTPAYSEDFGVWRHGQPATLETPFQYRETILVTRRVPQFMRLVVPDGRTLEPLRYTDRMALFIVSADWPTGAYAFMDTGRLWQTEPRFTVTNRWNRQFTPPEMMYPVEANFADEIKLLGYDLPTRRVEPGGGLPITLHWQSLDWLTEDYTIFARLLSEDETVHGERDRLPQEGYRTMYWVPDEIISDPFGIPVDADAPDGVYHLHVGLYQQVSEAAVSLPLVQNGQATDVTSVRIGPIKVGDTPPEFLTEATPRELTNQSFGESLLLFGYDLTAEALTLYWRTESPPPLDYTTFVHLRDESGQTIAQHDQPPPYPTSLWDSGDAIAQTLPLPPDLAPGAYDVVIGLYDFHTGQRVPVPGGNADQSFTLQRIAIP